jgi:hypothetical protein
LRRAEQDYSIIELLAALERTQYVLAVVLHNLGPDFLEERDLMASKRQATASKIREYKEVMDERYKEVVDIVQKVGVLIASN